MKQGETSHRWSLSPVYLGFSVSSSLKKLVTILPITPNTFKLNISHVFVCSSIGAPIIIAAKEVQPTRIVSPIFLNRVGVGL